MQIYARIEAGRVAEIITIEVGTPPLSERYAGIIVESCVLMTLAESQQVQVGWHHDGAGFTAPPPPFVPPVGPRYVPVATMRERLETDGTWVALVTILQTDMPTMLKVLTLSEGVDAQDPQARALITAAGSDPDEILKA